MRRMILPLMLLFAACQPATMELTDEQKAEIAADLMPIHEAFWDAWQIEDVDRGMSYYLDSPEFAYSRIFSAAEEGQKIMVLRGFAAFDEFARSFMDVAGDMEWVVDDRLLTVLANDVVHVLETGTVGPAGATTPPSPFTYTHVWVRRDGEWKVLLANAGYVE